MKQLLIILLVFLSVASCKSRKTKTTIGKTSKTSSTITTASPKAKAIIKNAKAYEGTRYKYGGTTKKGMDCSGLVYTTFKQENKIIPRTTRDLASYGTWVDVKALQPGDLIFFATKKNSRKVNHVGIVTFATPNNVEFIHASSSKGVIISSLAEKYWFHSYVQSRRVL